MEEYQRNFIRFLRETGKLVFGEFTVESGRVVPYYIQLGENSDGANTARLGRAFANALNNSEVLYDILYGIPEKGIALAIATSLQLLNDGTSVP